MVKSIFINAFTREITEVEIPTNNVLRETYRLVGNGCNLVQTGAYFKDGDSLMVDEEGYFKEGLDGFYIHDKGFFYGNGVIWGVNLNNGDSANCKTSIDEIKNNLIWVDKVKCAVMREKILNNL
jgi:hypothetical protein